MSGPIANITVQSCIHEGEQRFLEAKLFFGHGTDNAADESLWLVFYQLDLCWDCDASVLDLPVSHEDYLAIKQLFTRRINERIPAAYLIGEAWFAGYAFTVNNSVLVPRSPIAELIHARFQPWLLEQSTPHILDLCTGSGCIGIASALQWDQAHVTLSDISADAIEIARQNIQRHQLQGRVDAVESNVFDALAGRCFDLIVANPPYVDASDLASMPPEYHAEPAIGLGSGDDGLDLTRQILANAADYLSEQGILIVEVGNSRINLEAALPQVPFTWIEIEQGGCGVFIMLRQELLQYQAELA